MVECDLLKRGRRLAKQKGLDPNSVYCPPDHQAACSETDCFWKVGLEDENLENLGTTQTSQLEKFKQRAERSLAEMRRRRDGKKALVGKSH